MTFNCSKCATASLRAFGLTNRQRPQASSLYFFYPLAGPGGRLAFHPLARKGRLPVHPLCISIGGTITDFTVDPFDSTRVFIAGDDSTVRVFTLPDPAKEWEEAEVLTDATRTLTGASA